MFPLLTMLTLILLFVSVLGRDLVRTCPAGQSCVAFTHCGSWCEKAENGLVGRDLAVRTDLQSSTCNFLGSLPYVCCPQCAVTQDKLCSPESEIKHLQPSKDTAQQCGQVQSAQLRCVGCNSTSPGDWPWMARLLYKENIGQGSLVTSCEGVLVSSRHLIIAGHCLVAGQEPDRVALGD